MDFWGAESGSAGPQSPPLGTDTYVAHLLPDADDRARYRLEAGVRFLRHLSSLIPELVRASLRDGHEHAADVDTADWR